jgi:tyrosinase
MNPTPVVRKDIRTLSEAELDDVILAFYRLQSLDATDADSFFQIAGYHGEPFRGAGYSNPSWWGGYCNHGNILFPTWHRAYLYHLEQALQRQVPGVAIPYWNEIDEETTKPGGGLPDVFLKPTWTFTSHKVELADGTKTSTIDNPLHHYRYQKSIMDRLQILDADYSKPAGRTTVRFPFSGLFGAKDVEATDIHNNTWEGVGPEVTNRMLNTNVQDWLNKSEYQPVPEQPGKPAPPPIPAGAKEAYRRCLDAPNYLVFSNTTSAERWNDDLPPEHCHDDVVVPLESPHNKIHLAIGGIQIPLQNATTVEGANGDMAENDTASFDPIFFFHHCFVDRMFWAWQTLHDQKEVLEFDEKYAHYPGTNSVDAQGPTPGVAGNTWLSLESPLDPFVNPKTGTMLTSRSVTDIANLGYKYDTLPPHGELWKRPPTERIPRLTITGTNRAAIRGSFFIAAWLPDPTKSGVAYPIGIEAVLSRWHVAGCANCQNHLEVSAHLQLPAGWTQEEATRRKVYVLVHTREHPEGLDGVKKDEKLAWKVWGV